MQRWDGVWSFSDERRGGNSTARYATAPPVYRRSCFPKISRNYKGRQMRNILVIGLVVLLGTVGCDSPTDPLTAFPGTYQLRSVNGQSLPYVVAQSGPNTVSMTADQIVVTEAGTWSEVATFRLVENGATRTETHLDSGAWVRSGSTLSLYSGSATAATYSGPISAGTLTLTAGSLIQVFAK